MVLSLNATILGDGPPLVILHGLFGSGRNWGRIARGLADLRTCHCLDLRNHGSSPWAPGMRYDDMADDVADYLDRQDISPCDMLGHSMGGKVAMTLALGEPERIGRLLIADIAPVTYRHDSFSVYLAAMQGLDLSRVRRRADADALLAPAIPDASLRSFLLQNLESEEGGLKWRLNLAAIAEGLPDILAFTERTGPYRGPTVFYAGEHSDYIRPRDEPQIRRLFPTAQLIEVALSGHWMHADQPDRFLALLRRALA